MSVMQFVLFSAMLKTSSACYVFNNFAWLLLVYKQSNIAWSWQTEKKDNGFIYYRREVFDERTVQVEFHIISLL